LNKLKNFLMTSKNITHSGAFWNMVSGMTSAFQSVIMLIVISHVLGMDMRGIYLLGNTSSNLFLFIGKFGMRPYQVSDLKDEYSFRDYHMSRVISCAAMIMVSVVYTLYSAFTVGYSPFKTGVVILMCMMRVAEAYEDVYYGDYQKKGRLDIGAKCMALRVISTIILFILLVIVSRNLLFSVTVSTIYTFVVMTVFILITRETLDTGSGKGKLIASKVVKLFLAVMPLFLANFFSSYIGSAPKYSIDRFMDDKGQAIYGYVTMPVFVVGLLSSFIFNPIMVKISRMWAEREKKQFIRLFLKQLFYVLVITVVCLIGAYAIGVPVMSLLYNTDLAPYKVDILLIVVASGFMGLAGIFVNALTIMRHQKLVCSGYILCAAVAFILSDMIVRKHELRGAVLFYLALLTLLSLYYAIVFMIVYKKDDKTH